MKNLFLTIVFLSLFGFNSCKDKDPKITKTIELSEEMMAYFVNYQVGTKWIYQDTIDKNNYDTIELVSIRGSHQNVRGTLYKGSVLDYLPKKSKNFQIRIDQGVNQSYYVKVYPMVTAAGAILFDNINGKWSAAVTYYDSIEITGTTYYNVIKSKSSSDYHAMFIISKNVGCVFFSRMYGSGILADYKLIKTIKP